MTCNPARRHPRAPAGPGAAIAALVLALAAAMILGAPAARADLDGHGPDAWRVTGVAADDVLNARMGPGTGYPVIETFGPDERGLQQVTCVPYYTLRHYTEMTEAQIAALPPRWCLMRDAALMRAGWVAQRFITPDDAAAPGEGDAPATGDAMIDGARNLVRALYDARMRSDAEGAASPLRRPASEQYFTADIVADLEARALGADPLFDAQDVDAEVTRIAPDGDQPMLRGMITINADHVNFGRPGRTVFRIRADPDRPGAPLRIFRIENAGWSIP